jgi:hypothetical protein
MEVIFGAHSEGISGDFARGYCDVSEDSDVCVRAAREDWICARESIASGLLALACDGPQLVLVLSSLPFFLLSIGFVERELKGGEWEPRGVEGKFMEVSAEVSCPSGEWDRSGFAAGG